MNISITDETYKRLLIGGNHLASYLLGEDCFPDEQHDYKQVLNQFNVDVADVWVAWKAIMHLRHTVESTPSVVAGVEGET